MDAYHALAASYDRLTNDIQYEETVAFYMQLLEREKLSVRTAADLACGTGSVALLLAQKGMQVIGVDMSEEMLCVAQQKAQEAENPPVFVCQRLEKLNLPRGVDLAVCALDSMNYITNPALCRQALGRIFRVLNPGGCFIFDVNTPEKLRAMDDQIWLDEDDDVYCVWRGEFDEQTRILSYAMDLFQRRGATWERSYEEHLEYAYTQEELTAWLKEAGFTHIEVFADRQLCPPRAGEQRIYLKARKGKIR